MIDANSIRRHWWFQAVFLILSLLPSAYAADLTANINEVAPRSRRIAPEWIEVSIRSNSTAVREGALEFTMFEWGSPIYHYRTHEFAINTGSQRFRFLLPSASASGLNSDRHLRLEFLEKDRKEPIPLGDFPLISSQHDARAQVIAVVRPAIRGGAEGHPLWQAFRLERFAPKEGPVLDTTPAIFEPGELPGDPLGFTPFDLVLIEADSMGAIRGKSRDALAQWVAAGGSLCVVAASGVDAEHVDWLNALAHGDPKWKPLTLDDTGHVRVPDKFAFGRVDFGRLLVVAEAPRDEAAQDTPSWRRAGAYLWKMRTDQADNVVRTGKWTPYQRLGDRERFHPWGTGTFAVPEVEYLIRLLMPKSVRVVPMPAVLVILGVFVLMIGPGDWFLLGFIRRRRWTWVLFPLVAVLATGATVLLARHYTGTASVQSGIIVTDLGADGRVVRETQIEYELPIGERLGRWSATNALRWPMW